MASRARVGVQKRGQDKRDDTYRASKGVCTRGGTARAAIAGVLYVTVKRPLQAYTRVPVPIIT
jgi:hypothetical protein